MGWVGGVGKCARGRVIGVGECDIQLIILAVDHAEGMGMWDGWMGWEGGLGVRAIGVGECDIGVGECNIQLIILAKNHAEVESRERQEAAAKKAEVEVLALLEGMGVRCV